MKTRDEYLNEAREELGEREFSALYVGIDNEYYRMIELHVKQGKTISKRVYDSLSAGQSYHFNKHYNHRGDMVTKEGGK